MLAMPCGQRVLHRLGGTRAVLAWLVCCFVRRVVLHAVWWRHVPRFKELDELQCVRARVLLSCGRVCTTALCAGQLLERDQPLRSIPVLAMPCGQRVLHRLGRTRAVLARLVRRVVQHLAVHAVRRRYLPA